MDIIATMRRATILISLALVLAASLASLLPLDPAEDPAFPLLLGLRKPLAEPREVLIVEAEPGTALAPSRLTALLTDLAEFESGPLLVELPVDWSAGENSSSSALGGTREAIARELGLVQEDLRAFWQGLRSGSLRPADASATFDSLLALVQASRERLLAAANPPPEELPALLASLSLAAPTTFGLPLRSPAVGLEGEEGAFLAETGSRLHLPVVKTRLPALPALSGLDLPPLELRARAAALSWTLAGSGEPRTGAPGKTHQHYPLATYEGRILPSAALLALARRLEVGEIQLEEGHLRLRAARLPRRDSQDLLLPFDGRGRLSYDRPAALKGQTRKIALEVIEDYRRDEATLVEAVQAVEKAGYLVGREPPSRLWTRAEYLRASLLAPTAPPTVTVPAAASAASAAPAASPAGGPVTVPGAVTVPATPPAAPSGEGNLAAWLAAKRAFVEAAAASLDEKERIDSLLAGLLSSPGLTEEGRKGVEALGQRADAAFASLTAALDRLEARRSLLAAELGGSFCVIGEKPHIQRTGFVPPGGAVTEDPSGDTAEFLRAGLSGRFIGTADRGIAAWISAGLGLMLTALLLVLRSRQVLAAGLLAGLGFLGVSALSLVQSGLWVSPLAPLAACLAPGLVGAAIRLRNRGREPKPAS